MVWKEEGTEEEVGGYVNMSREKFSLVYVILFHQLKVPLLYYTNRNYQPVYYKQ